MQIRIFTLAADASAEESEELNKFLRGHRILGVQQELLQQGNASMWCFCVRYLDETELKSPWKGGKKDYKELLEPEAFARFSRLRALRKELAQEEAVPAYVVFTDDELAQFARLPELSKSAIISIQGIGKQKLEKYGEPLLARYGKALGESDPFDSGT
jgi:superfamily II DNA helicase RecQ